MNRVFADASGGRFILRIEDTDQARSSSESESAIIAALKWLGLGWDEGPDVGGPHGPYRQSERLPLYQRHAEELIDMGEAFHCFCSPERLEAVRREQMARKETPRYDGACLKLSEDEVKSRIEGGAANVIRLKVPTEGVCGFEDRLRGEIQVPWKQVDMQVLIKSDGFPTYHMAACVDDQLMQISHLIRGEEWISSVPKHQLLARAFGWTPPAYVHLPLIRTPMAANSPSAATQRAWTTTAESAYSLKPCSTTSAPWAGRCLMRARFSIWIKCARPSTSRA